MSAWFWHRQRPPADGGDPPILPGGANSGKLRGPELPWVLCTVRFDGSVTVVWFRDLACALWGCPADSIAQLARDLRALPELNSRALILDFQGRDFLPVAAFEGQLVLLARALGGRLVLCNLPVGVADLFRRSHLHEQFCIVGGFDEALAKCGGEIGVTSPQLGAGG